MFQIAKSIPTEKENLSYHIIEISTGHTDPQTHQFILIKNKVLDICIFGNIHNQQYCLHFTFLKPIEEYSHIKPYEKIPIDKREITDQYLTINGKADLCLNINAEILRFSKVLIFRLFFQNGEETIFGTAEFEIELSQIMASKE